MKKVFIIVNEATKTTGHGSSGKVKELATYDGYAEKQYPAFDNGVDAQKFIDKVSKWWKPQIIELPIYKSEFSCEDCKWYDDSHDCNFGGGCIHMNKFELKQTD